MKKLILSLVAVMTAFSSFATQYCSTPITSTDGTATVQLSCEQYAPGMYRITVAGENLAGFGGSFYNPGAVDLRNSIVSSSATEIVCEMTVEPSLYTPLYVLMPGEKVFTWPTDIEWGACSEAVEDNEAPVLTSATLVSNTHNEAVIAIVATDNIGVAFCKVYNGETLLGNCSITDGQITVKNLDPATDYTLTITAVDAAGNESAGQTVTLTTESFSYCHTPFGHLGDANFGDPNGRARLTIEAVNETTIRVTVEPNIANGATLGLDYLYVDPKFGTPITTGADIEEGIGEGSLSVEVVYADAIPATMNFTIQWSNPAWGGRWSADVSGVTPAMFCAGAVTPDPGTDPDPEDPDTTAIMTVGSEHNAQKLVIDGQVVIIRDGVRYNVLGAAIR